MMKSAYVILGVAPDADLPTIELAYAARVRELADWPDAVARCKAAHALLTDLATRTEHDRALSTQAGTQIPDFESPNRKQYLWWGIFLLGGVLSAVIFWRDVGPRQIMGNEQPSHQLAAVHVEESSLDVPEAEVTGGPTVAVPDQTVLTEPSAQATTPVVSSAPPKAERPQKGPGFDPAYMAWSVFLIKASRGRGSGVMVAPERILTNCHVIAGSSAPGSVQVIHSVTGERVVAEKVSVLSNDEDVCMLEAPGAVAYPAPLGRSDGLDLGVATYTVSFPGGRELAWSKGELLDRHRIGSLDLLMTSNYCRPGVSGGPLFDESGRVLGLTSAHRVYQNADGRKVNGECVVVPAEVVRSVFNRAPMPIAMVPWRYEGPWGRSE